MRNFLFVCTLALLAGCPSKDKGGDDDDDDTTGDDDDSTGDDDDDDSAIDGPQLLGDELSASLLSVWGSSATDVWAVGADPNDDGPLVIHWDGSDWSTVDTKTSGDLWWVWGDGADTVWMVGAEGRVLEHTVSTGKTSEEVLDADVTLFGIWGDGNGNLWTVGGNVSEFADAAVVYSNTGSGWNEETLPADAAASVAMLKVWGRDGDDVFVSGRDGVMLHWDGSDWTSMTTPTTQPLWTVNGTANATYAVGGQGSAVVLELNGNTWNDVSPDFAPQLNGVDARGPVAVGGRISAYYEDGGTWELDDDEHPTTSSGLFLDYHAVWVDPDGGIWMVGGHLVSFPLTPGIVVYEGPQAVADVP